MAYNQRLAQRIGSILQNHKGLIERKMFGGIAFMIKGNMCCGVVDDCLMLRVGPQKYEDTLQKKHTKVMDFTGRLLKSFVYVLPDGTKTDAALKKWIQTALAFVETLPRK